MTRRLCIFSDPEELDQGLFGQLFYYVLQLLPYLAKEGIQPQWELRTKFYGDAPDFITLPGVLDLTYTPALGPYHRVSISEMRRRHAHILGGNWGALKALWDQYFAVPQRVLQAADAARPSGRVLGIHYRGTDKQTATWDTNPISPAQYLRLIREFLDQQTHPFDVVFAATDQAGFVDDLRSALPLPVVSMGLADFHLSRGEGHSMADKADRAMLDCVLLSRCNCVIETSSALPSFAKLLNPELEIYRCAASKLFGQLYTRMPYFPVAHIPMLPATSDGAREILQETMKGDWTEDASMQLYRAPFVAAPRWKRNDTIFRATERMGFDKIVGRLVRGYA